MSLNKVKISPSLFFILSLSFLGNISFNANAHSLLTPSYGGFFKGFLGCCQKGQEVEKLDQVKLYLSRIGYLPDATTILDNVFDYRLETGIKRFQRSHGLNVTGIMDDKTVLAMDTPRCGVPDNIIHIGGRNSTFHIVSKFAYFQGQPKWNKRTLTYSLAPGTRADAFRPVSDAFRSWTSAVKQYFNFVFTSDYQHADFKISFQRRDHGDGNPFDGPGGILAHATAPTGDFLHFDADENWVIGARPDGFDMGSVALHEIGHLLGLAHSTDPGAVMFATFPPNTVKHLSNDDITGLRNLYGVK